MHILYLVVSLFIFFNIMCVTLRFTMQTCIPTHLPYKNTQYYTYFIASLLIFYKMIVYCTIRLIPNIQPYIPTHLYYTNTQYYTFSNNIIWTFNLHTYKFWYLLLKHLAVFPNCNSDSYVYYPNIKSVHSFIHEKNVRCLHSIMSQANPLHSKPNTARLPPTHIKTFILFYTYHLNNISLLLL